MKLLKNVKFGENVLCEDSTGSNTFDFGGATVCGGTFNDVIINGSNFVDGTLAGTINAGSGATIIGAAISGGSVTTDSFAFASCGGTFCGCGGTISSVRISDSTISGGYLDGVSFSCGTNVCGNGATISGINLCGNNCIDFTSGGWMQMYGGKYTPQVSGNQLIFVHS